MEIKKVGLLTGGGDCPGLNPVIRAIVKKGIDVYKYEMVGLYHGWAGLLNMDSGSLDLKAVSGILHRGGTILGTSRTNPAKVEGGYDKAKENFKKMGLDALIAIGGEDTGTVSVIAAVDKINGLIQISESQHTHHWSKNFFSGNCHFRCNVFKYIGANKTGIRIISGDFGISSI